MPKALVRKDFCRVAAVALVALALTGCDVMVNTMHGGKGRATDVWTRSYTLGAPNGEIEVVNVNGKIDVETADTLKVEVRAERTVRASTDDAGKKLLDEMQIREEVTSDRIRLESPTQRSMGRTSLEIRYRLTVPKTARVRVETVNGGIEVTGLDGALRAETTNGGVIGRGLGNNVHASATNGGIDVHMSKLGEEGITLETTNGGVSLRLPESAKATVSARCVNGGISVSDLPMERTGERERTGEQSKRRLEAKLNGGGPPVRLETVNGGIKIGKI